MKKALIVLVAGLVCATSGAQAAKPDKACSATLTVTGVSALYDPFENAFAPVPISTNVQTNGNCKGDRMQLALVPTPTTPTSGTTQVIMTAVTDTLIGTIESGSAPLTIRNEANAFSNNPISFSLGTSSIGSSGAALQLDMKPGQVSPPGLYSALLKVLYRVVDADGNDVSDGSTPFSISVTAKPSVRLAAISNLRIDVGEIQPGAVSDSVKFDSYSNIGYDLVLSSEHSFTLVRDGTGPVADGTPYQPQIDGSALTDSAMSSEGGPARKMRFAAPGKSGRTRQSFSIKILNFSGKAAGSYSDLVTMEIRPQVSGA